MRTIQLIALLLLAATTLHAQPPKLEPNIGWLNTDRPLHFDEELAGHVVLLDFWTHCCINCIHVLPDLEFLEDKYADEPFIVIGVHSAKFSDEGTRESVRQAMQRYDIKHPVVVDDQMRIWRSYAVRSWPTFVLIGADEEIIGAARGEGQRHVLDSAIRRALDDAHDRGIIADKKIDIEPGQSIEPVSGLRFPGKVHAQATTRDAPGRLFIADSSADRVIVASWPDQDGRSTALAIYGTGNRGFDNGGPVGSPNPATFHEPQGMDYDRETDTLYVADTKNHAIRAIDLGARRVRTIAGTGKQTYDRIGGNDGKAQGLSSPWDVALSADATYLYIAMAGPHQIWQTELATGRTLAIAGGRAEDISDGPSLEAELAQPSGLALASDGLSLYFADSEVSAIRQLSLHPELMQRLVRTIIGTGLFNFGDVDGAYPDARLQHPLGVTVMPTPDGDRLLVADTYNDKIKLIDPELMTSQTWLDSARLDEPGGLHLAGDTLFVADTNNHRVVMIDVETKAWQEISLSGLRELASLTEDAIPVRLAPRSDPVTLQLTPDLPDDAHPNAESPTTWRALIATDDGVRTIAQGTLRTDALPIEATLPRLEKGSRVRIELSMAYCFGDAGVCLPADAAWIIDVDDDAPQDTILRAPIQ